MSCALKNGYRLLKLLEECCKQFCKYKKTWKNSKINLCVCVKETLPKSYLLLTVVKHKNQILIELKNQTIQQFKIRFLIIHKTFDNTYNKNNHFSSVIWP